MRYLSVVATAAAVIALTSCEPVLGPLPEVNTQALWVTSTVSGNVDDVEAAIEWQASLALGESPDLSYSVIVDYPDTASGTGGQWRFSGLTDQELALQYLPLENGATYIYSLDATRFRYETETGAEERFTDAYLPSTRVALEQLTYSDFTTDEAAYGSLRTERAYFPDEDDPDFYTEQFETFTWDGPTRLYDNPVVSVTESWNGTDLTLTWSATDPGAADLDAFHVWLLPGPSTPQRELGTSRLFTDLNPMLTYEVVVQAVSTDGGVSHPFVHRTAAATSGFQLASSQAVAVSGSLRSTFSREGYDGETSVTTAATTQVAPLDCSPFFFASDRSGCVEREFSFPDLVQDGVIDLRDTLRIDPLSRKASFRFWQPGGELSRAYAVAAPPEPAAGRIETLLFGEFAVVYDSPTAQYHLHGGSRFSGIMSDTGPVTQLRAVRQSDSQTHMVAWDDQTDDGANTFPFTGFAAGDQDVIVITGEDDTGAQVTEEVWVYVYIRELAQN